jgi:hypothetical protein
MRNGKKSDGRELLGIKVAEPNGCSWMIFNSKDEVRGEFKCKRNEIWPLQWLPIEVRHKVYSIYCQRKIGDSLFQIDIRKLRDTFKEITEKIIGRPLHLHDLRKVSITWLWAMRIDLSIATELNVGWKSIDTAKKHYLDIRKLLKKPEKEAYRNNIPSWFKEGLEEYIA